MKKFSAVVLSFVLICSLLCTSFVLASSPGISADGVALTQTEFSQKYATTERADLLQTASAQTLNKTAPAIDIVSAVVNGSQITFVANITADGESKQLLASGPLYKGYVQEIGSNSVVGALEDQNENFKVIWFNIYNDTTDALFYSDSTWYLRPHLKVYLEDSSGELFLFETEIPKSLLSVTPLEEFAPSHLDCFWFLQYVPYTFTEERAESVAAATPKASWESYSFGLITLTTYLNGLTYENTSEPVLYYKINDIVSGSTWYFNFEVNHQEAKINGTKFENVCDIWYTDVTINVGAGQYTTLDGYLIDAEGIETGEVAIDYSTGTNLALDILAITNEELKLTLPSYVTVGADILATIVGATLIKTKVDLGAAVTLTAPDTLGLAVRLPSGCQMCGDTNYFRTHVIVSFDDFGTAVKENRSIVYFSCSFKYGGYYTPTLNSSGTKEPVVYTYTAKEN